MKAFIVALASLSMTGCVLYRAEVAWSLPPVPSDPPGRVARLSLASGAVSFKAADTDVWVPATLNRPLTTGDELWTDHGGRAELDIGSVVVRLDSGTSAGILNLSDRSVQIRLPEGSAQLRVRRLDEDDEEEVEVDTPQAAILVERTGNYRIDVAGHGRETALTVRRGQAEVLYPGRIFPVTADQRAQIHGGDAATYEIVPALALDDFDSYCSARDRRSHRAESLRYVSPHVIVWEDLDEFGYWRMHSAHGWYWTPGVVARGWAPYRDGHWVWLEPWGWTWVDDAPWGFAPLHYGRWRVIEGVWVWIPGPPYIRAIYAPALVIFISGGHGVRAGVSSRIAWFPLGPNEVYIPPYRCSRVYVTNINVSHTVIRGKGDIWKTDMERQWYANRSVAGAVTAVPTEVFIGGRRVLRSAEEVKPHEAARTRVKGTTPGDSAARQRVTLQPDRNRPAAHPPDSIGQRPVTVRRLPPQRSGPARRSPEYRHAQPPTPEPDRIEPLLRKPGPNRKAEYIEGSCKQERKKGQAGGFVSVTNPGLVAVR